MSKQKSKRKVLIIVFILIVSIISFFIIKNRIEYKEWYAVKKIMMQTHSEIQKAKIRIKPGLYNLPWIDVKFYLNDNLTFEEIEIIFITFLKNFNNSFLKEMAQIKPFSLDYAVDMNVYFIMNTSFFCEFETTDFSMWKVIHSIDGDKIGAVYYLNDYK
jgi:hypothetical protein